MSSLIRNKSLTSQRCKYWHLCVSFWENTLARTNNWQQKESKCKSCAVHKETAKHKHRVGCRRQLSFLVSNHFFALSWRQHLPRLSISRLSSAAYALFNTITVNSICAQRRTMTKVGAWSTQLPLCVDAACLMRLTIKTRWHNSWIFRWNILLTLAVYTV